MNPYAAVRPAIVPPAPGAAPSASLGMGVARYAIPAALAAGTAYALHRGGKVQDEQEARMGDLTNARQHDMTATLPLMSVKNAHDDFYRRKLAGSGGGGGGGGMGGGGLNYSPISPRIHDAGANALAMALADVGVKQPLGALQSLIKKKLYTEPKQRRIFDHVIQNDPDLARSFHDDPNVINDTYDTLKFVAPNLATNRNAVRNFLRNGMMVGGNIDYSTIKTLAETEKTLRQARGEIGGH